jgi:hypothetical protein
MIPKDVWKAITLVPGLPAAVLDAAERGGLAAMNDLLGRHGTGPAIPPPDPTRADAFTT